MNELNRTTAGRLKRTRVRSSRQRYHKPTLTAVTVFVLVFSLILVAQLVSIQVFQHDRFKEEAANQQYSRKTVYPRRGAIYDRNGVRIAGTKTVYRIGITPKDAKSYRRLVNQEAIVTEMVRALKLDRALCDKVIKQLDATYILLKKDVPEREATAFHEWLDKNAVGGFRFDAEPRRVYNNGDLAGQVIGYTRFTQPVLVGALGLERAYDSWLAGRPGYAFARRDNFLSHGPVPYASPTDLPVTDGADLYLTIDLEVQRILKETLEETALSMGLTSKVTGMVMDPWTGAILAMEQIPTMRSDAPFAPPATMRPDAFERLGEGKVNYLMKNVWRNQNVSDLYEPGSTMKAITAAIAFDTGTTNEQVLYNDKPISVLGRLIRCHTGVGHGIETLYQGFLNSCNPVFVQVGMQIGKERFYDVFRSLGFYERTGIDLPGEARALIHKNPSALDFANLTFGESSVLTPIQMLASYAALANGGYRVTPHVVDRAVANNVVVYEGPNTPSASLFSDGTTARIRSMMEGVATLPINRTYGTEGYRIGGKTSTATDEIDNRYTYSYMVIAPINAPRIVAMIVIHKPNVNAETSVVASRPTNRLVSRVLDHLGVPRTLSADDVARIGRVYTVPNLVGQTVSEAAFALSKNDVWAYPGSGVLLPDDRVAAQSPAPGSVVSCGSRIYLYREAPVHVDYVSVPDFSGKTFFACQTLAADAGVTIHAVGVTTGGARAQTPAASARRSEGATHDEQGAPEGEQAPATVAKGSVITVSFGATPVTTGE